jgi:uncharacterized membrane protein YeaQ/YmgE (transglycosylase-associated protein family)
MSLNGVGILAAIIVGGLAGWLAEKFMSSQMGLLANIVLGISGRGRLELHSGRLRLGLHRLGRLSHHRLHRRLHIDCGGAGRQGVEFHSPFTRGQAAMQMVA